MGRYLSEKEAREDTYEALRKQGFNKRTATREADASVGRVFDQYDRREGLSRAERERKPRNKD